MSSILKNAVVAALATALYVVAVGAFLFYAGELRLGQERIVLVPIAMLLLLVFSAALVGILIFGRPAMWYLDGRKRDAMVLLGSTLAILFGVMVTAFAVLIALR